MSTTTTRYPASKTLISIDIWDEFCFYLLMLPMNLIINHVFGTPRPMHNPRGKADVHESMYALGDAGETGPAVHRSESQTRSKVLSRRLPDGSNGPPVNPK